MLGKFADGEAGELQTMYYQMPIPLGLTGARISLQQASAKFTGLGAVLLPSLSLSQRSAKCRFRRVLPNVAFSFCFS